MNVANEMVDEVRPGLQEALLGYHLRRAAMVFASDYNATMAHTGVRQVLFGILSVIATNPGISQGRVGAVLGIQRANMVNLVNEVEEQGWLERRVLPDDRRAFALNLTPAGEAIVVDCLAWIGQHEDRLLMDLSQAERALLMSLLQRIHMKSDIASD